MQRRPAALLLLAFALALSAAGCAARRPGPAAETALGMRAAEHGLWREAALRFERASDARPDDAAIWNDLGVAYESLGRFAEAARAYDRARELAPGDRRIRENAERFGERHEREPVPPATPVATP